MPPGASQTLSLLSFPLGARMACRAALGRCHRRKAMRCQLPQQPLEPAAVVAAAAGEAVESAGAGAGAAPDAMLHQPRSRTHWPRRLPAALAPQPLQHDVAAGSGGSRTLRWQMPRADAQMRSRACL